MIASVIKRYIWVINLILLAGISYTIAKIATDRIKDAVTPPVSEAFASSMLSPENRLDSNLKQLSPRSSYNVILTKNIFNLKRTSLGSSGLSVREVSEGVYEVDQKMLEEALSDPNQLMTQARAIPQDDGLKFFAIRPNSVFF